MTSAITFKRILEAAGRGDDYVEISLDSPYRYNPLHNDLDAYALAYGIASLLNNLFGKSREPFWQQAYTNLVKFIILLHKVLYDYVTLFDVYECAINPDLLEEKIQEGEASLPERNLLLITVEAFMAERDLETYPFERDPETGYMKAPLTDDLASCLREHKIDFKTETDSSSGQCRRVGQLNPEKRQQFEAVKRWFYQDWKRVDPRLRTSIVEGIAVFLSLFDDNPAVKRVFCPPKETYDPVANQDGSLRETPSSVFGTSSRKAQSWRSTCPWRSIPGLPKPSARLLKQDFQRAVLNRIPRMEREPHRHWRECSFSAMNTMDSPQSAKTIPRATKNSSRFPARRNASPLSPPRASARCARLCPVNPGGPCCRPSGPRSSWRSRMTSAPGPRVTSAARRSNSNPLHHLGNRAGRRREHAHRQGALPTGPP